MTKIDIEKIADIIAEVGITEIMPRFRKLAAGDIEMKGVNDPVTVADKAAEKALIAKLTALYPGSVVVGEESFADDPKIIAHFAGDKDVWVIDPIDGTRSFVEGTPEFGVMVALMRNRKTLAAWIHDPNTGDTLMGEEGGGVWLRGHKMHLAGLDKTIAPLGIIGARLKKLLSQAESDGIFSQLPPLVIGAASAFDYGRLFTGAAQFGGNAARASFLMHRQTKPWDHVPGLFLHSETGGYAATLAGHPYEMEKGEAGLLVAPSRALWQAIYEPLKPYLAAWRAS